MKISYNRVCPDLRKIMKQIRGVLESIGGSWPGFFEIVDFFHARNPKMFFAHLGLVISLIPLTLIWMSFLGPTYGWGGGLKQSTAFYFLIRTLGSLLMIAMQSTWSNEKKWGITRENWTSFRGIQGPSNITWVICIRISVIFG